MSVLAFAISTKTINLHQVDKHKAVNGLPKDEACEVAAVALKKAFALMS